jgi:hypothetical protein
MLVYGKRECEGRAAALIEQMGVEIAPTHGRNEAGAAGFGSAAVT